MNNEQSNSPYISIALIIVSLTILSLLCEAGFFVCHDILRIFGDKFHNDQIYTSWFSNPNTDLAA